MNPEILIGTWQSKLCSDQRERGVFRITKDLEFLSFDVDYTGTKWYLNIMFIEYDPNSIIRMRNASKSVVISYRIERLTDNDITIEEIDGFKTRKWVCTKIQEDMVPAWFEERFGQWKNQGKFSGPLCLKGTDM